MKIDRGWFKISPAHEIGFGIVMASDCEGSGANVIARLFGHRMTIRIPNWACPRATKMIGFHDPVTQNKSSYEIEIPRKFGFTVIDETILTFYGPQTHDENSKTKMFSIQWLAYSYVGSGYLDTDNLTELHWVPAYQICKHPDKAELEAWIVDHLPNVTLVLEEEDGTRVSAHCIIQERVWNRGIGWFSWIRYFTQRLRIREIEIKLDRAIGSDKNTWNRGVMGIGIKTEPGVPIERALENFFLDYRLKVIQVCYNP